MVVVGLEERWMVSWQRLPRLWKRCEEEVKAALWRMWVLELVAM
jgi:hypothetical protein